MIHGTAIALLQAGRKTTVIELAEWKDKKITGSLMISLSHKLTLKQSPPRYFVI